MTTAERRRAPRYVSTASPTVTLEWPDGGGSPRGRKASVVDAGLLGACLTLRGVAPAKGAGVKLRVPQAGPACEAPARVVASQPRGFFPWWRGERRPWTVRVEFLAPCPYEVFKSMLAGFVSETEPGPEEQEEGFDYRHWR